MESFDGALTTVKGGLVSFWDWMKSYQLNPLSMLLASAVFAYLRTVLHFAWSRMRNRFVISMEIPSRDDSFSSLVMWLNDQKISQKSRQLLVSTSYAGDDDGSLLFTPSIGEHFFRYANKYIWLSREREDVPDIALGGKHEVITMSALGTDTTPLKKLMLEAAAFAKEKEKGKLVVYTTYSKSWRKLGNPEEPRNLDSIFLDSGNDFDVKQDILNDIEGFLGQKEWYKSIGIPYRRGYLLHGPPGCGKSSFIKSLAGKLGLGLCLLNLNNKDITDESLNALLNETPKKSIVVIEDIDAAMHTRDDGGSVTTGKHNNALTLSGLLNALDGIGSAQGRIMFLTTNKPSLLDEALTRPGRVDRSFYFEKASRVQIAHFARAFFPDQSQESIDEFVSHIAPRAHSMAEIQKYLMCYRSDFRSAARNVGSLSEIVSELSRPVIAADPDDDKLGKPGQTDGEELEEEEEEEEKELSSEESEELELPSVPTSLTPSGTFAQSS
eukprot:TRINITY_DN10701_c0_g1_i1.p1 TRINITY_DN10701_c0_g1~~TRINITY_DN10701_c0_g1_i1.p1  ORF type:complete len:496 (-),score=94.58 TRINITY_DN10701_c0_g1_i1:175-1662(-)